MSRQISTQEYLTPRSQYVPNPDIILSSASRMTPTRIVPRNAQIHSNPRVNQIASSSSSTSNISSPRQEAPNETSARTLARSGVIIAASSSTSPVRVRAPEQYYDGQPLSQTRVIKHVYVNMPLKNEDEDDVDLDDPPTVLRATHHAPLVTEKSSTSLRRATPGPSSARIRTRLANTAKSKLQAVHNQSQSTPTSEDEDELRIGAFDVCVVLKILVMLIQSTSCFSKTLMTLTVLPVLSSIHLEVKRPRNLQILPQSER